MLKTLTLPFLMLIFMPINMFSQTKKPKAKTQLTEGDKAVAKFRKENPKFYENHIMGLAESSIDTGIDYSNLNGKNCSEIANKENWSKWSVPNDADKRCEKFLKMKKLKKIALYPFGN